MNLEKQAVKTNLNWINYHKSNVYHRSKNYFLKHRSLFRVDIFPGFLGAKLKKRFEKVSGGEIFST